MCFELRYFFQCCMALLSAKFIALRYQWETNINEKCCENVSNLFFVRDATKGAPVMINNISSYFRNMYM